MLHMTTNVRAVNDNVIQVNLHKFQSKVTQYILHYLLECTRSVSEAHRHH